MYRSSPLRSTLNTGYITGLDMCKVCAEAVHCAALWTRVTLQVWTCVKYVHSVALWTRVMCAQSVESHMCASAKECHHPHPTPPHPTLSHVMCARVTLGGTKMMQNCACVYLWLQSVCAGDSGKWLCAHVTPVCVRGWLWVEKSMPNCACVYLWLQSVCAGDCLTVETWHWGVAVWVALRFLCLTGPAPEMCLPPGALEGCRHVDDFCECTLESASLDVPRGEIFWAVQRLMTASEFLRKLPVEGGSWRLSRDFTRVLYIPTR